MRRRKLCVEVKAEVHDEPHDVADKLDDHEGLSLHPCQDAPSKLLVRMAAHAAPVSAFTDV